MTVVRTVALVVPILVIGGGHAGPRRDAHPPRAPLAANDNRHPAG